MYKETVRLDEIILGNSLEITVSYNRDPAGIEITSVTLGSTDIMDHLDEVTLQILTEEICYGTL